MSFSYQHLLPQDFSGQSRVWVYQASRLLTLGEALQVEADLDAFVASWQTHGHPVKGWGSLLFGQFLILIADETSAAVSGCSTDSSVRFVKDLGTRLGVDFFNRTGLAFVIKDKVQVIPLNQVPYAREHGFITGDTLYFNNLVATLDALRQQWLVPVEQSWLARR